METKKNKPCILIVDDEADIREILEFNLSDEGFEIDTAESAEEALNILSDKHRLILLDVMMGGMSGFRMAEKLRKSGNNIPIIFLTAKDTENDMLTGFSIGADDYISKPFSVKEVIARVKSILRRFNRSDDKDNDAELILIGNMFINDTAKTVTINEQSIDLTKTEYKILVLLASNDDKLFSRDDILSNVWGRGQIVSDRTVDVHIARLRKKIGDYAACIVNRSGYGYSFNADLRNTK